MRKNVENAKKGDIHENSFLYSTIPAKILVGA
jgi:hypothetical protein